MEKQFKYNDEVMVNLPGNVVRQFMNAYNGEYDLLDKELNLCFHISLQTDRLSLKSDKPHPTDETPFYLIATYYDEEDLREDGVEIPDEIVAEFIACKNRLFELANYLEKKRNK